jgi:hypothetical protein
MSATNPQRAVISWQLPNASGAGGAVGQLILDVTLNEQHAITSEATTHPVETGSDITDHIRALPQRISLEGMISNTPLRGVTSYMNGVTGSVKSFKKTIGGKTISYSAFTFDGAVERVREVYGDLISAIQGAALFNLTTTLAAYDSMACLNFAVPRNAQLGNALRFTMDFQRIIFVNTETVAALPSRSTKHRGAKTGKEVKDPTTQAKARSTLKAIVSSFGK